MTNEMAWREIFDMFRVFKYENQKNGSNRFEVRNNNPDWYSAIRFMLDPTNGQINDYNEYQNKLKVFQKKIPDIQFNGGIVFVPMDIPFVFLMVGGKLDD